MKIKPGCLCILMNTVSHPEAIGRVVTAVRLFIPGVWEIDVPGFSPPEVGGKWLCRQEWLKPINDPDLDVTEPADALLDNLLDVLQYTKEAA